jgi:transposase-like protein
MEAMAKHRSHSIEFKRQIAQEFIAGETLHGLAKRHDVSRNLIRIWVKKLEAGAFDEDARAADLLQEYEAKIAALERMVGRQALSKNLWPLGNNHKLPCVCSMNMDDVPGRLCNWEIHSLNPKWRSKLTPWKSGFITRWTCQE